MGFRQAGVLSTVGFFLGIFFGFLLDVTDIFVGVLCMCFTIDHRILHLTITPEATQDATHFYTLFYNAPPGIKVGRLAFIRGALLINRLKGFPSLDDGNRHRLFIGKTSPVG